jgi:hypothetical protein
MSFPWKKCAGCPSAGYHLKLQDGLCTTCQVSRKSIAEQAALEAKVETYLPKLVADCDRLAAFHAYLLERDDSDADEPAPATRWSRLGGGTARNASSTTTAPTAKRTSPGSHPG